MQKLIVIYLVATVKTTTAINATARVTLTFIEVDLWYSTAVNLTARFVAHGVTFDNTYRYLDQRGPWSETSPQDYTSYGVTNSSGLDEATTPTRTIFCDCPHILCELHHHLF